MGQKVNPIGFRIVLNKDWQSRWYANKADFGDLLREDTVIRNYLKKRLYFAGVPRIVIERASNRAKITIHAARPGIIIGRKGAEIDRIKQDLAQFTNKELFIDIVEVKDPDMNAQLVAENIANQLERRVSHRRAMKKAVTTAISSGAEGIKILCSGRLGGSEMSRSEGYKEGKIPLHTLRADIDYGFTEARTTYGAIGVKVWICKGEKLPEKKATE
ncbi:MAG: 30S ribosomal protein S3 [Candidatus Auribacter fodinae]|jgi:small subunit ribosomal protein S3|uniref:Small ribosomal subunit protein uS3 n=1 Tax=Candidatus Auribacter fodinae TaxID=2093366 RepID=A0A3A4R170_9BACT|nr:MAG: 30S ribosomal protein S3 [Candidatus Auribacter fodinae]